MLNLPLLPLFTLNKYSRRLRLYPFAVNLDSCMGSCNTSNDLSSRVWSPDKTECLNLNGFNMGSIVIEGIRTLFFKNFKKKKRKSNFEQT